LPEFNEGRITHRFAVGTCDGPRSAVWRVWRHQSDVYIGVRVRAGDFKISLHESGECHEAFSSEFLAGHREAFGLSDRLLYPGAKWQRKCRTALESAVYAILIPHFCMRHEPQGDEKVEGVTWYPDPGPGRMSVLCLTCHGTLPESDSKEGGDGAVSWALPSGETWHLRFSSIATPKALLEEYERSSQAVNERQPEIIGVPSFPAGLARALLFLTRDDGLHCAVDIPVEVLATHTSA
jgi:hypothetical protein